MTEQHYLTKHYTSYTVWDEKTIIWNVEKFLLSFIKNYICSRGMREQDLVIFHVCLMAWKYFGCHIQGRFFITLSEEKKSARNDEFFCQ